MSIRWSELAEWRGPTSAHGGAMVEQRGMVVHIAEGSYEGTIAWQKGPNNVSSHFVVASPSDAHDGRIGQVVDLDVIAWTQQQGNGHWVSVENSGFSPHALSAAQVEANAQLYARGMKDFGWPAKLATSPADRGLAYHGIACAGPGGDPRASWTVQNTTGQAWGHCDCPGGGVIAQLPAILARAIEIHGGDDMTPEQANQLQQVFNALFKGGTSCGTEVTLPDGTKSNSVIAKLDHLLAEPPAGGGSGTTKTLNLTGTFTEE